MLSSCPDAKFIQTERITHLIMYLIDKIYLILEFENNTRKFAH